MLLTAMLVTLIYFFSSNKKICMQEKLWSFLRETIILYTAEYRFKFSLHLPAIKTKQI